MQRRYLRRAQLILEALEDRQLLSANPALGATAAAFTHSYEYYANRISADYRAFLGRSPATSEVNAWVQAMQRGLSDEQVEAGFVGSPEYYAHTGNTGQAWVEGMYHDLLGRTPSQAEVGA